MQNHSRLFVAIDLPLEIKEALQRSQQKLQDALGHFASYTKRDQMHLTLCFLGEIENQTIGHIIDRLKSVQAAPLTLALGGAGIFGSNRNPHVIWIDLKAEGLAQLAKDVQSAVLDFMTPDERAFTSHVTLARIKRHDPSADIFELIAHLKLPSLQFTANEFILYRSEPTAEGAKHVEVDRFKLF